MREWCLVADDHRGAIFEYIETLYNPKRRHAALGYQSPIQYENNMKLQQPLAA
ncbi:MAG TPA: hypothetical protein EYN96_09330 [Candidatus Hydrogenedentes bacterium]|nr:hypothetical protein [Candidatus Hydrogenedentota bacterium]HIB00338.1 hypothetical protein [Phycisphaerales bacterium]